jgi:hypothetical protein
MWRDAAGRARNDSSAPPMLATAAGARALARPDNAAARGFVCKHSIIAQNVLGRDNFTLEMQ